MAPEKTLPCAGLCNAVDTVTSALVRVFAATCCLFGRFPGKELTGPGTWVRVFP